MNEAGVISAIVHGPIKFCVEICRMNSYERLVNGDDLRSLGIAGELQVGGRALLYRVVFHDEVYTFEPQGSPSGKRAFSVRREHNDWTPVDVGGEQPVTAAIEQLEAFLLSQH